MDLIRSILPVALLAASLQATAAEGGTEDNNARSGGNWNVLLGGGAINQARYPGSRYDFTRGVPVVSINYDRYFVGGAPGGGGAAGIGAYLVRTEHWTVGLNVGGDSRKPRRASDDPILHGWGDIPGTARGGMFASYSIEWLSVRGSVSAGGHHEGVEASLGVEAKYRPAPRLTLSIGPQITWVNEQYGMTFFGINTAQSEIAGFGPYRVKSGINTLGAEVGASYVLTQHWSLAAHVSYGRLQGDAANSPVTTDKTQRVYGAFVMYRF